MALAMLINAMPGRSQTYTPDELNPMIDTGPRGIELNTANPMAEAALDACAEYFEKGGE